MASHQGASSSVSDMEKCIIVAVADNMAIGKGNDLPWHLPADLKFFKKTTIGCPVIMGRATYLSIGRPLPKRQNIVLSRSAGPIEGVTVVRSLEEAYAAAEGAERCFVIGGASIYKAAMNDMDKLYVTHVHTTIEDADAYFPEIDPTVWEKVSVEPMVTDEESGVTMEFTTYIKTNLWNINEKTSEDVSQ